MAKNSVRDYSSTNSDNTDIQSIDISEGCAASGINNAIREVMVDLKNVSTGAVALETPSADQLNVDNLRLDGNTISSTDTNGNVTIDPDGTGVVDVVGTFKSDIVQLDAGSAPTWDTNTRLWSESGFGARYDGYQHRFDVGVSRTEAMRITTGGTALIGSTSARATGSKLELTNPANTATVLYMFKTGQVEATMGFKASTDSNFYIGSGSTNVGTNGVYLTNTGNSWNSISDETQKTIVENIENASEKVSTLRTVMGYYNHDENETRRPFLIAQDVQAVLPEAVSVQDAETGVLGMSYTDVIPLLTAAIKEQRETINALQARITALEAE